MSEPPPTGTAGARDALDQLLRAAPRRRIAELSARIRAVDRQWLAVAAIAALALAAGAWVMLGRSSGPAEIELPRATPGATAGAASPSDNSAARASSAQGSATTSPSPPAGVVVDVVGAVMHPGLVTVGAGARVADAVAAAGGGRPDADLDQVNLAQPLTDGVRVLIPVVGQAPATSGGVSSAPADASGDGSAPSGPIDLNTATAEQLDTLPGVGPATAKAIIDHRTKNGPFRSVDDLLDVRGIGPAKLDALRDAVTASGR
jgi:competence protein ComEA